jgi:hypothetical protein
LTSIKLPTDLVHTASKRLATVQGLNGDEGQAVGFISPSSSRLQDVTNLLPLACNGS